MSEQIISSVVEACAAGMGTAFSSTTVYPLERARNQMIQRRGPQYKDDTIFKVLQDLYEQDGLSAVYRGCAAQVTTLVTRNTIYFYFYSFMKQSVKAANIRLSPQVNIAVGFLAGIFATSVTTPIEVASAKIQNDNTKSLSLPSALLKVYQEGGISALWKGYFSNIVLCLNPAIHYASYEQLKMALNTVLKRRAGATLAFYEAFLLGVVAKTISTLMTYPFLSTKVLQQGSHAKKADGEAAPVKESTFQTLYRICQTDGFFGMYKGVDAQLYRTVVAAGLMLMAKEKLENWTRVVLIKAINAVTGKQLQLKAKKGKGKH